MYGITVSQVLQTERRALLNGPVTTVPVSHRCALDCDGKNLICRGCEERTGSGLRRHRHGKIIPRALAAPEIPRLWVCIRSSHEPELSDGVQPLTHDRRGIRYSSHRPQLPRAS